VSFDFEVPDPKVDELYRNEHLQIIQWGIDVHPRSSQFQVGPSEIGGCPTKLAWKLAYGGAGDQEGGWAAHKGTVLHAWLDHLYSGQLIGDKLPTMPDGSPRFFSDLKLRPISPHVNGGTLDLYDRQRETIVDWKLPGDWTMKNVRGSKLSPGYYVQAQTYAKTLMANNPDMKVSRIALMFLPMCGDDLKGRAKGAVFRYWDYDPEICDQAMGNIERIKNMLAVTTPQKVMEVLPKKSDFCQSCPAFAGTGDRRAVCPGAIPKRSNSDPSNPFAK
jgi:hypothetical protein